jgi:hypothetical protein|tara:strand:+ start:276 stop:665 length:390 start_codon:yes stop_codon:yes gene_type:complete
MSTEIKEFLKEVEFGEEKIIAVDFDGVIHTSELGFHDGTVYGELLEGAASALEVLSNSYKVILMTSKANPKRPLINGKTGKELIWEWLKTKKLDHLISDITYDKINASYYIDDKAIRFTDWQSTLKQII